MQKSKFLFLFLFLFISPLSIPQNNYEKKYVAVIPGEEYEAGWLHNVLFGAHWRELWTTPVKAEVLDLDNYAGGLVPLKKGGGYQTKTLHFKGNDGQTWKFRSINKDPKKVLPPELQESIIADIVQDQISSSNPLAPLVVVPLLEAVGVLQAKPFLVVLPDHEKLGEFRKEFGGEIGMIEIHPTGPDEDDETGFANSDKVSTTHKLFETLEEKRNQHIDDREFLKARLMDIFLGDWDRHSLQWRWARFDEGDKKTWLPIPKDRDQVFAKYDGLFPSIGEYLTPQLNTFDYDYPKAEFITWNGRFVDRRFLTELDKPAWDSITHFVQNRLTDDVIENAVKKLPAEAFEIASEELITKLKSRRNKLVDISNEFYDLINKVVDIYGSSKDDYFEVNRISDSQTSVTVYKKTKDEGSKNSEVYYHKIFDDSKTDELRLYLLDGDDSVVVNGVVDVSPLVRIIGGEGADKIIDNSVVNGYFLSVIPIPDAENKTKVYDSGNKTEIFYGPGTCRDDEKIPEPATVSEKYEPQQRDRGHEWFIFPEIGFNSDDGFIIGGGPLLFSYNFRAVPYEYKMHLTAAYASNPKSYLVSYEGDFNSLIKGTNFNLRLFRSGLSLTKYFGFGNETSYSKDLEADDFYKLSQELITIHPALTLNLSNNISTSLGISYNFSDISLNNDTLFAGFGSKYGSGDLSLAGIHSAFKFDTRDNELNSHSGMLLNISSSYYPEIFNNKKDFISGEFDVRSYFSTKVLTDITFALRAGGEKVWGRYPFFKAAFLGGTDNLRGYSRERFSGDASLFGQTELRAYLTQLKIILLGRFGFYVFAETGRVFVGNDDSEKWHPSYGGGLWISYLQKQLNLTFTLANSPEKVAFYFQTRFMF